MRKRFAIVIGVAAAGVMALGAQGAAAVDKFDTKLTISNDRGFLWHGWVISEVRECEQGRLVVLFKQRPGADRKLGTDRSVLHIPHYGPRGRWGDITETMRGHVYAKVRPKVGDEVVCRADRSPNYDGPQAPFSENRGSARVSGTPVGRASAAAAVKHETELTITQEGPQPPITLIHGYVNSGFKNCEAHRQVVLFKKRAGADRKLGTVLSGPVPGAGRGIWGIEVHGARSGWHVYAKVTRKVLPGGGGLCRRDRSRTYRVRGF